jgi:hypothetical protein
MRLVTVVSYQAQMFSQELYHRQNYLCKFAAIGQFEINFAEKL